MSFNSPFVYIYSKQAAIDGDYDFPFVDKMQIIMPFVFSSKSFMKKLGKFRTGFITIIESIVCHIMLIIITLNAIPMPHYHSLCIYIRVNSSPPQQKQLFYSAHVSALSS